MSKVSLYGARLGWVLIPLAMAVMTWYTWGTWPEPLMDFGRDPYFTWRITTGKVLYRDMASIFGPLSPYFNAALFHLFGVSIRTLVLLTHA